MTCQAQHSSANHARRCCTDTWVIAAQLSANIFNRVAPQLSSIILLPRNPVEVALMRVWQLVSAGLDSAIICVRVCWYTREEMPSPSTARAICCAFSTCLRGTLLTWIIRDSDSDIRPYGFASSEQVPSHLVSVDIGLQNSRCSRCLQPHQLVLNFNHI